MQKGGLTYLFYSLESNQEDLLTASLKLTLTLISRQETFIKQIGEARDFTVVKTLLQILQGPGIIGAQFSHQVLNLVLLILR
jgi:hypothetical protein